MVHPIELLDDSPSFSSFLVSHSDRDKLTSQSFATLHSLRKTSGEVPTV